MRLVCRQIGRGAMEISANYISFKFRSTMQIVPGTDTKQTATMYMQCSAILTPWWYMHSDTHQYQCDWITNKFPKFTFQQRF